MGRQIGQIDCLSCSVSDISFEGAALRSRVVEGLMGENFYWGKNKKDCSGTEKNGVPGVCAQLRHSIEGGRSHLSTA